MTSRNAFDAFAVARGEGLQPFSELAVRGDGLIQAGPNPASDALAVPSNATTPVDVETKTPLAIRSIRGDKSHPAQK
jgi:hypothetical protein